MFELMDTYTQNAVIKVIGVGGGGGNAVEHMVSENIEGVVETTCTGTTHLMRFVNEQNCFAFDS